jgi:hypothetical protein
MNGLQLAHAEQRQDVFTKNAIQIRSASNNPRPEIAGFGMSEWIAVEWWHDVPVDTERRGAAALDERRPSEASLR